MGLLLKNGNYIKLSMNNCYIDTRGVHTAYYRYRSLEDRNKELEKERLFNVFSDNVHAYLQKNYEILSKNIKDISNISTKELLLSNFDDKEKELFNSLEELEEDYIKIECAYYDNYEIEELNNKEHLIKLGYSSEITKKINKGVFEISISSPFTNQKFTYNLMYKELKKLFRKEGYEDC